MKFQSSIMIAYLQFVIWVKMTPFFVAWKLAEGVGVLVDFFGHIWLYRLIYTQAAILNPSQVGHGLGVWRR